MQSGLWQHTCSSGALGGAREYTNFCVRKLEPEKKHNVALDAGSTDGVFRPVLQTLTHVATVICAAEPGLVCSRFFE